MATYVFIPGAGDVGWYWHLVAAELERRGHETVAPDLPCDDESAGLEDYARTVIDAIGDRGDLIVVSQSLGSYTAPLVCDQVPAELMVLVAPMVPRPGESCEEMLQNTRYAQAFAETRDGDAEAIEGVDADIATFYHDVPRALAEEALRRARSQAEAPGQEPWPLVAWPDVPTRCVVCRDDRLFPAAWLREVIEERLGISPDEIDSAHTPALSHPEELADRLEGFRSEL